MTRLETHIAKLATTVIRHGRTDLPVAERVRLAHGGLAPLLAQLVADAVAATETGHAATQLNMPAQGR